MQRFLIKHVVHTLTAVLHLSSELDEWPLHWGKTRRVSLSQWCYLKNYGTQNTGHSVLCPVYTIPVQTREKLYILFAICAHVFCNASMSRFLHGFPSCVISGRFALPMLLYFFLVQRCAFLWISVWIPELSTPGILPFLFFVSDIVEMVPTVSSFFLP